MPSKKSHATLNREIAQSLAWSRVRSHATKGGTPRAHDELAAPLDKDATRRGAGARGPRERRSAHATKVSSTLFAVEIDPREFDRDRALPADAEWRDDRVHLAETELGRGRTHRRPKDARYAVVEWTGFRGAVGRLLDWLEASPGITRYAEIFEGSAHATRKKRVAESQEMKDLRSEKESLFSALGYAGNTSAQVRAYHKRLEEVDAKMRALVK